MYLKKIYLMIYGKPLGITDDYMFYFVMQDEAICTQFLQDFFARMEKSASQHPDAKAVQAWQKI